MKFTREQIELIKYVTEVYLENTEEHCDDPELRKDITKLFNEIKGVPYVNK